MSSSKRLSINVLPRWSRGGSLVEGNPGWAERAAALVAFVARTTFEHNGKPSRTHAFDTGAAWMSLALQDTIDGLIVHAMQGFDYDRAEEALNVPEGYTVQAMAAIGRPGATAVLGEKMA